MRKSFKVLCRPIKIRHAISVPNEGKKSAYLSKLYLLEKSRKDQSDRRKLNPFQIEDTAQTENMRVIIVFYTVEYVDECFWLVQCTAEEEKGTEKLIKCDRATLIKYKKVHIRVHYTPKFNMKFGFWNRNLSTLLPISIPYQNGNHTKIRLRTEECYNIAQINQWVIDVQKLLMEDIFMMYVE